MTDFKKKILAIIPARGGSKGLPGKNIRPLVGKPLLQYTIDAALASRYVGRIVVTSEDDKILEVAGKTEGLTLIKRPEELARDETPMTPVTEHALSYVREQENYEPDIVLLLQPTCPLRIGRHIDEAVEKFLKDECDSLLSILILLKHQYKMVDKKYLEPLLKERPNRQQRAPVILENGVIYLTKVDLVKQGLTIGGKTGFYEMTIDSSINIDTLKDFEIAERLIKGDK